MHNSILWVVINSSPSYVRSSFVRSILQQVKKHLLVRPRRAMRYRISEASACMSRAPPEADAAA